MKKIPLLFISAFAMHLSVAQNSTSPAGKGWGEMDSVGVYTYVEQMPQFPEGDEALIRFLQQNIKYPQMERDSSIKGNVLVQFVIMENGKVDDVKILRHVSFGIDSEAVRVVKMLPDFIPRRQEGKEVKVYYKLPLRFKL
ncbi:MAG: energy transducer TonB [Bacteroidetes bacterium]|nr:energy transducer TonB [Bacteroidota bacterium]